MVAAPQFGPIKVEGFGQGFSPFVWFCYGKFSNRKGNVVERR